MTNPATAPARTLLSIDRLSVVFDSRQGAVTALDEVSFDIAAGEILGVVGESGAGKSLTGTAVIGLLDPPGRLSGGAITLDGRRLDRMSPEALRKVRGREIGAVFQDPLTSLHPLLKVGDQIVETITTHLPIDRTEARARALDLLKQVGIPAAETRIDHYPHQFSGGMRQRVVIALALCAEPALIIADEPTTALDVSIQAQITTLLKRLCREKGTAIMLITHDMGVIAETADRVAVMYAGRLVEIGPVDAVVRRPRHPYTAGLMASIPSVRPPQRDAVPDQRLHAPADGDPGGLLLQPTVCAGHGSLPRRAAGTCGRPPCHRLPPSAGTGRPCLTHAGAQAIRSSPSTGCAVISTSRPPGCSASFRARRRGSCALSMMCPSASRGGRPSASWASRAAVNPPWPA